MSHGDSDIARILTALCHGRTDRVPNFEIVIDPVNASHILGEQVPGLWQMEPETAVRLARTIGQDAIPCVIKTAQVMDGAICNHADMDRVCIRDIDIAVDKMRAYLAACEGSGVGVCAVVAGPLTAAYMAAGPVPIQSFMLMLYDEPELVRRLLDFFTEYTLALIKAVDDLPFHFYYVGDDVTGFMSPEHLEQLWVQRQEMIIRAVQARGRPVLCHCCGDQSPVLPWFSRWRVDGVHPLQPDLNDIYTVSEAYPDLCLVGNIDVSRLLSFGTPVQVRADVLEHCRQLADRAGGYVLSSSHSIIDAVKPENFRVMLETARHYAMPGYGK